MLQSDYSALLKWQLGIPLIPGRYWGQRCAACGRPVVPFGVNSVMCQCSGIFERHLGTQNYICQVLRDAGIAHKREQAVDGGLTRPADIFLTAWRGGRDVAIDVTIVHVNQVHRPFGFGEAKATMEGSASHKRQEHGATCQRVGVDFEPLVMDTWVCVHGTSRALWNSIVSAATRRLRPVERARVKFCNPFAL